MLDYESESEVHVRDSGKNSSEPFAYFDPVTWWPKTCQGSLLEDLEQFSGIWPRSGSMVNGMLYERLTWVRPIDARESSSSRGEWQSPMPSDVMGGRTSKGSERPHDTGIRRQAVDEWLTPNRTPSATSNNGANAGRPATGKSLTKQADGRWPTPIASDGRARGAPTQYFQGSPSLTGAVQGSWPTPQAYSKGKPENSDPGLTPLDIAARPDLAHLRKNWPTPQTTDANSAARHTTTTGVMNPGTSLTDAIREDAPKLWPTPNTGDAIRGENDPDGKRSQTMIGAVRGQDWPTPIAEDSESRTSNGTLLDKMREWPTPDASIGTGGRTRGDQISDTGMRPDGSKAQMTLESIVARETRAWPTPNAGDATRGSDATAEREGSPTLTGAVNTEYPTPAARDYRYPNRKPYAERGGGTKGEQLNNFLAHHSGPPDLAASSTRGNHPVVLNEVWVSCLMGFQADWLDVF